VKINKSLKIVSGVALISSFSAISSVANAADGVELKWSGQISRAISFADNGVDDDILFVDNNNNGTRLRLTGKMEISPGLTAGIHWETQFQENSSASIDIGDSDGSNSSGFTSRKRDLWFKGGFGKISLGQGDGAANGTSEVDFSGTTIADYSGNNLDDGISFADSLGNKVVKNGSVFSNFDGLSRNDRVRYDVPNFGPIGIAISGGQDRAELGLRFSQKMGGGSKLGAALGYVNNNASDFNQLGLSASYITAGGLSVTGHYGERDRDGAGVDPEGFYIKVGQKLGPHNVSLAYQEVDDLAAAGDSAERVNLAWVYNIKSGVEIFAAYQNASLDRAGGSLEDQDIFSVGSRIKF
jgi:predicted porin